MLRFAQLFILILFAKFLLAQDSVVTNGYQLFYYPNHKISSEGTMVNGKPNGYWKTYNKYGTLVSEGNRKNFLLDSTWNFYNDEGKLSLIINYKKGKKSGIRKTFFQDKIVVDSFDMDVKNNWNKILYPNGKLKNKTFYKNGLEQGWAFEYAKDGRIITRTLYNNGFIKKREYINAYNHNGKKQGIWETFYSNNIIKESGRYRNGIKDGYFKYYDKEGNLTKIEKYRNGLLEENPNELLTYELRTDYYKDGSIKTIGSYKDGKAEGVRREYAKDGKITDGFIMHKGIIVGHGIIDNSGKKQGLWKHYYDNGRLRSEGKYVNDKPIGLWKYYYENGVLEQTGHYDKSGLYTDIWKWYYKDGSPRVIEQYFEGEREGDYVEYSDNGDIMMQGEYVNGNKEGDWKTDVNGFIEEGTYLENVKDGEWKYYYAKDTLYFTGRFIDGNPDGEHIWYYRNGTIKTIGNYIMGLKDGIWKYFDPNGKLILKIRYKDGIEQAYDAIKIEPALELKDMEE